MIKTFTDKYLKQGWILAFAITAIVLFPTLSNGWINWDDTDYVLNNPLVKQLNLDAIAQMFSEPVLGNYHPLTILSFAIDYSIGGENAFTYHLTNLTLHLINVVLVFLLFKKLFQNHLLSFFIAILFGIHPMHVESVAFIAQRKDMLYGLFFLLALLQYLTYIKKPDQGRIAYILSLSFFLLALLSKSMAVTLPFVLLLTDYLLKRKWSWSILVEKAPFFVIAVAFILITLQTQSNAGAIGEAGTIPWSTPFFAAGFGVMIYLVKSVVPFHLSAYHPYPISNSWEFPLLYKFALIVPLLLLIIAFIYRKRSRTLTFGILFFLVTILPVIQLIPVGSALYAERYTYIPYLGIFTLLALILPYFKTTLRKQNLAIGLSTIYLAAMSIYSYKRAFVWESAQNLWSDVINKYPTDFYGYWSLGNSYLAQEKWESALANYQKALKHNTTFSSLWLNIGVAESQRGNIQDAIGAYSQSLKNNANPTLSLLNRGSLYFNLEMQELAMNDFNAVLKLDSNNIEALTYRGVLFKRMGQFQKALVDYSRAIALNQNSAGLYYNRGFVYYSMKDFESAIKDFSISSELDPNHAAAHYWRSVSYYKMGNIDLAKSDANIAQVLGFNVEPEYLKILGISEKKQTTQSIR